MERQQPNEHERRLGDEDLVNLEIQKAAEEERPIGHAGARVLASLIHDGQRSAMYALASSGALVEGLEDEIAYDADIAARLGVDEMQMWMAQLAHYVETREDREPVEGWSDLWLQQPETTYGDENRCNACGSHVAEPHAVGCPLGDEEEPAEDALAADRAFNSKPDDELTLEETIRRKFVGMSTARLIQRMERAADFSTDDEEIELNRRLKAKGQTWKWSESFSSPHIIVVDVVEGE
ncbi:hypothetical protein [Rhodococcus sp. NPDC004095]